MHDMILLSKISKALNECCVSGNISKVNKLVIVVNKDSHVNSSNLYDYLRSYNTDITHESTEVKIEIDDLPDQVAIIKSIEGDKAEDSSKED